MGLRAYRKTSVYTASKEEILLMLYRGAIKNCKQAITAIVEKKIEEKNTAIAAFQEIIAELNSSINPEPNPKLADELQALYEFLLSHSTMANLEWNKKKMDECLKVMQLLYEGWEAAIKELKREGSA
jgi:flagellar protein FliS